MIEDALRQTGIAAIGDVPWGTHFCQFYKTKQDLLDLLVPYFTEGLAHHEFCMWVTSEPIEVDEAKAALRQTVLDLDRRLAAGQLEIISYADWYHLGGAFDADRVLNGWVDRLNQARGKGFEGLRLSGNTFWLESTEWAAFTDYEARVNRVIGQYRMMALCTYSLDKCGASEVIDVVSNHRFALIKRHGHWARIQSAEQQRVEEELRESEEWFRTLTESLPQLVWTCLPDGRCDYLSRQWIEYTGIPETAQLGYGWIEQVHPDDRRHVQEVWAAAVRDGTLFDVEFRIRRVDGQYRWFKTRAVPLRDPSGSIVKWFGTNTDIEELRRAEAEIRTLVGELKGKVGDRTAALFEANAALRAEMAERRQAEDELHRSKERFQSLVETIGDWIWEIDQKGRYTYVSPRIKDLLGYEPADLIGKTPFELMPPDEAERVASVFEAFLSAHAPFSGVENTNLHKDGRRIVLETSGTPIFDDKGRFLGYRGVDRDITERKKAEVALKKIEWLLTKKLPPEEYVPPYGNLLALNASGEILRSVGESTLVGIVRSYLDLLGTSAAVYEKNGDYACGIFSSGWCRFMDQASRQLCGTGDNRAALQSGKWLCHESCWNDASKVSMETDQENDIPCKGGIRLYAVPIRAGEEVIGSLNFGYGQPPQDPQKLRELAEAYGVPAEQLLQLSRSYEAIPPFILDLAKKNARAAAQLIGDMVLRKRTESELKQSREMLRRIIDNIPQHVFWKDLNLNYLGCNALFARGAGVDGPDAIVGKNDFDLAWNKMAEQYRADDRLVMESKVPKLNFEELQTRPDGSLLWLKTSKVPLIGRTGQVLGVLGIYEDITARKDMEARTSRLERLAAMGRLLSGIAHELKNPLFILTGYLQIVREKLAQRQYEALAENCQKVQDTTQRLTDITERFLRLALPVTGQQQRCSVPDILQNALDLARNELEQNRVAVRADYAPDLPETWLDAGQVREVFLNLITNAIQAMAEARGQGTLTVNVQLSALSPQPSASEEQPSAPVEQWIEVRIQDDGPGIPPELRTKIFEPFFTTKPAGKGTGLGLWVVRSNLMMLHGTVRVETETGKGATFIVQLPVVAEPSLSVDPPAPGSGRG